MKKIQRSRNDRIIAGVCGGFAEYLGIDPTVVRIIWILFTIFGGFGILAYIISIILISEDHKTNTKEIKNDDENDDKLLIWGIIIIVVGISLLFRNQPFIGMMWHSFSGNWFNILFGLAIIGIGAYIIFNRKNDDNNFLNNLQLSGLHLSETDKKIAGVCGGIAETINVDSTIVRLIWIVGSLLSAGIGVILYIICMLVFNKSSVNKEDDVVVKDNNSNVTKTK